METVKAELKKIEAEAQEVYQKAVAGEDFDALIAQYGEDPGMTSEPYKTTGYLISENSTGFLPEFVEAASALENAGDISAPVASYYGYHIIKKVSEVPAGVVPYEDVKETLTKELADEKKREAINTAVKEWENAADIEMFKNRLN